MDSLPFTSFCFVLLCLRCKNVTFQIILSNLWLIRLFLIEMQKFHLDIHCGESRQRSISIFIVQSVVCVSSEQCDSSCGRPTVNPSVLGRFYDSYHFDQLCHFDGAAWKWTICRSMGVCLLLFWPWVNQSISIKKNIFSLFFASDWFFW